jgi:formylglycine-generating enzyme required for sulfatase activity
MSGLVLCMGLVLAIWLVGASRSANSAVAGARQNGKEIGLKVAAAPRRIDVGQPAFLARVRDCNDPSCPWLRVLPAGQFTMGGDVAQGGDPDEAPAHRVSITTRLAVMETEVTVGMVKAFAAETRFVADGACVIWNGNQFVEDAKGDWRHPFVGVEQDDRHPAVCLSWHDAQHFARWMSRRTGQHYRLLSEAEWEYAARAGSRGRFPFGDNESRLCAYANVADRSARRQLQYIAGADCDDGNTFVARVGSFLPNAWGLYDMIGNVWEWVQDCKRPYTAEPSDATAVEPADCPYRLLRGGGWGNRPSGARSANRDGDLPTRRDSGTGFRLARVVVETAVPAASH